MKLKLSEKDRTHVELFRDSLKSTHLIRDFKNERDTSISIYSTKMVNDLIKLGCVNNKTFKIRLPEINFMSHFIRGYFDGDGSISKIRGSGNLYRVNIAGNDNFIKDLQNYLRMGNIYKQVKISILSITKISKIKEFRNLIYDQQKICLNRKLDIFKTIKENYKRDFSKNRI